MSDSDNPVEAGTESARPQLSVREAASMDWDDLGSEESTTDPDEAEQQDEQAASAPDDEGPVAEQANEEPASEEAEAKPVSDDVIVTMRDGAKLSLADLKRNYETAENLARRTQEVAEWRRGAAEQVEELAQTAARLGDFIRERFVPPEPDPQLAWTDPAQHYRMTQARNSALQELMEVMSVKEHYEAAGKQISAADFAQKMGEEDAKLLKAFPRLSDPAKMEAFKTRINSFAKTLGFTEQEIAGTADHRVRMLVHYAALGKEAEAAKAKAQTKVSKAAPMLPAKQRQHPNSAAALRNVNAMKQLERTGSFRDAMKIDFAD